jgi:hypothetical protein
VPCQGQLALILSKAGCYGPTTYYAFIITLVVSASYYQQPNFKTLIRLFAYFIAVGVIILIVTYSILKVE